MAPSASSSLPSYDRSVRASSTMTGTPVSWSRRIASTESVSLSSSPFSDVLRRGGGAIGSAAAWRSRGARPIFPSHISEPPCKTIDTRTTTQVRENNGSLPGRPAKIGSRMSRRELKPRGPNQAIRSRSFQPKRVPAREVRKAKGRIRIAAAAKAIVRASSRVRPLQMSDPPKRIKVKSNVISAVVSPYSRKQSQSSTSRAAIVIPAANAARKPLPWTASAAA